MVVFDNGNVRVSVRNLVEFILRSGDIDNRYTGKNDKEAMALGSKIHRKIQGRMGSDYQAEVSLKIKIQYDDFYISVEGRADGIITPVNSDEDTPDVIIDEIKSMYADVRRIEEVSFVHKAQAMCYGYIYGIQNDLSIIGIRLTYVNIETEEIKLFEENHSIEELSEWFNEIIGKYYEWAKVVYNHRLERNETAKALQFPFDYREGQRDIVVSSYKAIKLKKELFIQAPTGVGKTMSVIFPAVKSIGENIADKIFYLTAKTITGTVAHQAYRLLRDKGLKIKTIAITAKDKICIQEETECNPIKCMRARGHYDRINDAIFDLITHEDDITREIILEYAEKHEVCPFEMCLDVSYFADGIVCDYNYAFDPTAKLKRYFSEGIKGDYVLLVDEAHNLVDRAREMFSASICKETLLQVKKIIGMRDKRTTGALERCNKNMLEKKRECGESMYTVVDSVGDFSIQLSRLFGYIEKLLDDYKEFEGRDEVINLYFEVSNFLYVFDLLDDNYQIVSQIDNDGRFFIRLMCINPAKNLKECMDLSVSTILYSATLLPVNYYKLLLSGDLEDYAIYISSPFQKEKRIITIGNDVSTKYTRRNENEYKKIAKYIEMVLSAKKGNYMIFFPSYKFMEDVKEAYIEIANNVQVVSQTQTMTESDREEFLDLFQENNENSLAAFCIMGGIFSEGIDLTNEKLIGTIVIGTGFPQVCMEREIIKNYFENLGMNGFDFAYRYPGMNKVLQAAGRVIRTIDDRGIITLLDERFLNYEYKPLFPKEWNDIKVVNINNISQKINDFWNNQEN